MTITPDDLDRLEALDRAAMPGPWEVRHFTTYPELQANSECAVAARNALPALIAEIRRLWDREQAIRGALRIVCISARTGLADASEVADALLRAIDEDTKP